MEPLLIQTERLLIREWASGDQEAFERLVRDPEVARWSGSDEDEGFDEPFIGRMIRNQEELGWALWAVELRTPGPDEPSGPVGWAGFGTESLPDPELAWTFLSSVWGRGYATEAGIAVRDYGFGVLKMHRMVSVVDPRNAASARVASKVGLVRRGLVECHGVAHVLFEMDAARWRDVVGM